MLKRATRLDRQVGRPALAVVGLKRLLRHVDNAAPRSHLKSRCLMYIIIIIISMSFFSQCSSPNVAMTDCLFTPTPLLVCDSGLRHSEGNSGNLEIFWLTRILKLLRCCLMLPMVPGGTCVAEKLLSTAGFVVLINNWAADGIK